MTGSTRRGFLGFLAAAPMAIPAAVKAAGASKLATGGVIRNGAFTVSADSFVISHDQFAGVIDTAKRVAVNEIKLKFNADDLDRAIEEMKEIQMRDFATDVNMLTPHDGMVKPTQALRDLMRESRRGDWMQTVSGVEFYPLDPRPQEIHIEDIAHSLSMLCRYGGHAHTFYSVAEHCVHVANAAPDELKLTALMHDASEAYLTDVIRPVKPFLSNYISFENRLMRAIADRFDFQWPMPPEVKRLDNAILVDERDQAMTRPPRDWNLPEPALGIELQFWTPQKARYEFLASFQRFGGHIC